MKSDTVEWDRIAREFQSRETDAVIGTLADHSLIDKTCSRQELPEVLAEESTWKNAFQIREGATLLAFALFAWGMQEWELTIDHPTVQRKLKKAKLEWEMAEKKRPKDGPDDCDHMTRLIMSLTDSLTDGMEAENSLNNSSVTALKTRAQAIVTRSATLLDDLANFDDSSGALRDFLEEIIRTHSNFYTGLEKFASAMQNYQRGSTNLADLEKTIAELETLETNLHPDVLATELPPYRRVLSALRDRMMDKSLPSIQFESVKLIYVYPFTFDRLPDGAACKRAMEALADSTTNPSANGSHLIAGVRPGPAAWAVMTDLFSWGPDLHSEGDAVDIPMPTLTVQTQDGELLNDYRVKIRITTGDEHYLRIEKDLPNPKLHDINQGLRRPSTLMGREKITSDDTAPHDDFLPKDNSDPTDDAAQWQQLSEYANEVIGDIRKLIDPSTPNRWPQRFSTTSEPTVVKQGTRAEFHTLLEIRSASARTADGGQREATKEEILKFAAPLLFQPINRLATAPEEWMCYKTPQEIPNFVEEDSFTSDFASNRGKTTVLYMPATPDWLMISYEEAVQYWASLSDPRMFGRVLHAMSEEAKKMLDPDDDQKDSRETEWELSQARSNLHNEIQYVQKKRMKWNSPSELVGSGNQRALLENLLAIAHFPESIKELDIYIEKANLIYDKVVERAEKLRNQADERARQRYDHTLQWILFFVGLFSFAGVVSLAEQELFGSTLRPVWSESDPKSHLEIVIIIYSVVILIGMLLLLVFGLQYSFSRKHRAIRSRRSEHARSGIALLRKLRFRSSRVGQVTNDGR
jgi:hypothetical protein